MSYIFFDTETTNVKQDKLEIIQLAYKDSNCEEGHSCYFRPDGKIDLEAMSVHHITHKKVADCQVFSQRHPFVEKFLESYDFNIPVAHNAKFDISALSKYGIETGRYIDTLKLAKYFDKNSFFKRYNLQYLRYALDIDLEVDAHDADGDVKILEQLFLRLEKKAQDEFGEGFVEKMIEISTSPMLLRTMPFGKHSGQLCEEVPVDYWLWLHKTREHNKENSEQDEDLDFTINYYLNK